MYKYMYALSISDWIKNNGQFLRTPFAHINPSVTFHQTIVWTLFLQTVGVTMNHLNTVASIMTIWQHCLVTPYTFPWVWGTMTGSSSSKHHFMIQEEALPLVNSQCSVPGHCFRSPVESELLLHGLSEMLSKMECCPTAHEVWETQ